MDQGNSSLQDRDLLVGCIHGEPILQEAFVRKFSNLVFATIQRVAKSKNAHLSQQSVDDLHQTVFLHLFENRCGKLRKYKGENGCSVASWIRLITSRIVLDHLRRGKDALAPRHQTIPLEILSEMNATEPSPLEQLADAEQWRQIEVALKKLKVRDQLVIRFHCLEGHSLASVAKALGLSPNTIHSVKYRAVQRLKKNLLPMN